MNPTADMTIVDGLASQVELITALMSSARRGPGSPPPVRRSPDHPAVRGISGPGDLGEVQASAPITVLNSLSEVLENRSSERFYGEDAVEPEQLAHVLRAAQEHDEASWPGEVEAGLPLDLLVAAHHVTGTGRGIYRLDGGQLSPVQRIDGPLDDLVLQIEFATAPVILLAVLPFADELRRWGDHGERVANLRAGGAIGAALLAGASIGLAGSPFAGFLAPALRTLLTVDGYENAQLFAASFGIART